MPQCCIQLLYRDLNPARVSRHGDGIAGYARGLLRVHSIFWFDFELLHDNKRISGLRVRFGLRKCDSQIQFTIVARAPIETVSVHFTAGGRFHPSPSHAAGHNSESGGTHTVVSLDSSSGHKSKGSVAANLAYIVGL